MLCDQLSASLLAAVLGLGCTVGAELVDFPSRENLYRLDAARATVLGNYVYVDGGEVSQVDNGVTPGKQWRSSNPVNATMSIDISKSWKTSDAPIRTIPKSAMHKANVILWTDSAAGVFYSWAGKFPFGTKMIKNALWKFTPDGRGGGAWSEEEPANPALFNNLHTAEFVAFANTNTTGFAIGGIASGWTEHGRAYTQTLPGMVAYNMQTKEWQNGTTSFSPFDTLVGASAHYVPNFGPHGLIVVMAGHNVPVVGEPDTAIEPPFDLRNLTLFDPETKKRYWQMTTGSIPTTPRTHICTTGFQNPDGGYEIFLTGGKNQRDKFNYQDAYVLSLPGFVWTRAPDPPAGRRQGASCVSVGKRQVLTIGGTDGSWTDADAAPNGLLVFDMSAMEWKDGYDAEAKEYEAAEAIKRWYDNGSLDKVEWSSDELKEFFVTANPTTNPPAESSTPQSTNTNSSSSTPVGAIVGGVIGGIAAIALIALAVWIFLRRRNKQNTGGGFNSDYSSVQPHEYQGQPQGQSQGQYPQGYGGVHVGHAQDVYGQPPPEKYAGDTVMVPPQEMQAGIGYAELSVTPVEQVGPVEMDGTPTTGGGRYGRR